MEAGGFEPPSRDISGQASTCIVVFLSFAPAGVKRQTPAFAISLKSCCPAVNELFSTARCATLQANPRAKFAGTGRVYYAAILYWLLPVIISSG